MLTAKKRHATTAIMLKAESRLDTARGLQPGGLRMLDMDSCWGSEPGRWNEDAKKLQIDSRRGSETKNSTVVFHTFPEVFTIAEVKYWTLHMDPNWGSEPSRWNEEAKKLMLPIDAWQRLEPKGWSVSIHTFPSMAQAFNNLRPWTEMSTELFGISRNSSKFCKMFDEKLQILV